MSKIIAKVVEIETYENITLVKFEVGTQFLSMMSLDISSDIKIATEVKLLINSSHVAIAKEFSGEVSYSNQIQTKIKSLKNGELLSHISLSFGESVIESIITKKSSLRMQLCVGESVTAFIKASDISIYEVLND
jgi:molybdopterin-binding protein